MGQQGIGLIRDWVDWRGFHDVSMKKKKIGEKKGGKKIQYKINICLPLD